MKDRHSKSLNPRLVKRIVKEKIKNPSISCRKLSQWVHAKYRCTVSKSLIHRLLKEHNIPEVLGRKKEELSYQKMCSGHTGLFFLKAADEILHLSESIAGTLAEQLPPKGISVQNLKKYCQYLIFSSFFNPPPDLLANGSFPEANIVYALSELSSLAFTSKNVRVITDWVHKNPLNLARHCLRPDGIRPLSAIRLTAADQTVLYTDVLWSQLWEQLPVPDLYFSNLYSAQKRLQRIEIDNALAVMCAPAAQGFSATTVSALKAASHGFSRIELLDKEGNTVARKEYAPRPVQHLIMGFNPATCKKSLHVTSRIIKDRMSFPGLSEEFYLYDCQSTLLQDSSPEPVAARIILMQKLSATHAYWGILTTMPRSLVSAKDLARRYLSTWLFPVEMSALHLQTREQYPRTSIDPYYTPFVEQLASQQVSRIADWRSILIVLQQYLSGVFMALPDTEDTLQNLIEHTGYAISGRKVFLVNFVENSAKAFLDLRKLCLRLTQENIRMGGKQLVFSVVKV